MTNVIIDETLFNTYFKSLLAGDKKTGRDIVTQLLASDIDIKKLYTGLFQRSLYQVGTLWEYNKISVAKEHLATALTESFMNLAYPRIFSAEHINKKAVITAVANEYHQIGARMVADIFELHGWDGYFLGANTPEDALLKLIDDKKPDVLGLSLSVYFSMKNFYSIVEHMRKEFPQLPIIIGGQAFQHGGIEIIGQYDNLHYLKSLTDLEKYINSFDDGIRHAS